jgi:quinol monooxygenase YgiN
MVQLVLKLKVTQARVLDVVHALRAVASAGQWNHGWLRAQAYGDLGDPDAVYYVEDWLTPDDAAREVRSARFSRLLELMETAVEPPDLQFQFINEVRGLDYVAEVRGDQPLNGA